MRIDSQRRIIRLKQDEIFVFGSNLAGRHGKGAALDAIRLFGGQYGQCEGLQGQSYAIPTKDRNIQTLPLHQVERFVLRFCKFAKLYLGFKFYVTRIGCGLAGFQDWQIAPLFQNDGLDNLWFPNEWKQWFDTENFY